MKLDSAISSTDLASPVLLSACSNPAIRDESFAAIENPDKKNSFIFKNSRLVSYESYMAELTKGGLQLLQKSLIEAFPDLYSVFGGNIYKDLRKNA